MPPLAAINRHLSVSLTENSQYNMTFGADQKLWEINQAGNKKEKRFYRITIYYSLKWVLKRF